MHKYIDASILKDFSKEPDFDEIWDDIYDNYKITGYVEDEEYMSYLIQALYDDIVYERANYKAYLEYGMTARMMMELRKSALIPTSDELKFYEGHSNLNSPDEVIAYRERVLRKVLKLDDYSEHDLWQYYFLLKLCLKTSKFNTLHIDYEPCFIDAKYSMAKGYDELIELKWESQRIPTKPNGDIDWDKVVGECF